MPVLPDHRLLASLLFSGVRLYTIYQADPLVKAATLTNGTLIDSQITRPYALFMSSPCFSIF